MSNHFLWIIGSVCVLVLTGLVQKNEAAVLPYEIDAINSGLEALSKLNELDNKLEQFAEEMSMEGKQVDDFAGNIREKRDLADILDTVSLFTKKVTDAVQIIRDVNDRNADDIRRLIDIFKKNN